MAASVRVEDEAFSDRRYNRLARLAGLADADHARGKMLLLWRQCTIEDVYELPVEDILDVLGDGGIEALEGSRLGELVSDTHIRICGAEGRIEWLEDKRSSAEAGGKARAKDAKRDKGGRFKPKAKSTSHRKQAGRPSQTGKSLKDDSVKNTNPGKSDENLAPDHIGNCADSPAPHQLAGPAEKEIKDVSASDRPAFNQQLETLDQALSPGPSSAPAPAPALSGGNS